MLGTILGYCAILSASLRNQLPAILKRYISQFQLPDLCSGYWQSTLLTTRTDNLQPQLSSQSLLAMSNNLPRKKNWLLIAEIWDVAKDLFGLLVLERLLVSSFVFPGQDSCNVVLLLAIWAGVELNDLPFLEPVVIPMLFDKLEVVVEIVLQVEFCIGSRGVDYTSVRHSTNLPFHSTTFPSRGSRQLEKGRNLRTVALWTMLKNVPALDLVWLCASFSISRG
jgi:hypothetical protein